MSEQEKDPHEGYVQVGWLAFWILLAFVIGVSMGGSK